MSLADYVSEYQERQWDVHVLSFSEAEAPKLSPEPAELRVCNSDSQRAQELKADPRRFYVDCELVAADLDPSAGAQVGRLEEDWLGHPAGSLVICSYEQVREQRLVFAVAKA